jgi:tetratricopeptide (TPR) repeat protein
MHDHQECGVITRIAFICIILLLFHGPAAYAYDEAYEKAFRYFKSREYRSAVPHLEDYVSRQPDPAAYYMLGFAYYQLRNYEKSWENFDQAYLIDPEFTSDKVPAHAGLSIEEQGLIHDALELSGAKKQMSHYADIVSRGLPQVRSGMGEEKLKNELPVMVRDSFKLSKIYPAVVSTFSARFNRSNMQSVIRWLKSPLGKRVTLLEVEARRPEAVKRSTEFGSEYDRLKESRKQRIRDVEKALQVTDLTISIVSGSLFEMLKGMQSQMHGHSTMNSEEIDALVESVRGVPREPLMRNVLISLAYTYRDLADEEIDAVAGFYQTPEGAWFSNTGMEAISAAIGKSSREIGEKIGKSLVLKRIAL